MKLLRNLGIGVVLIATVGAASMAAIGFDGWDRPKPDPATSAPFGTTAITRATLVKSATVEATLDHGSPVTLTSTAPGTLTWLPAAAAEVARGEALLRANDLPVVLLYGPLPMYRRLAKDVKGSDVLQFERNLRALGYSGFTVDTEFSAATEAAVKRWQKDLGLAETGAVEVGRVLYTRGPVRIAQHLVRVGARATGDLLTYTGTDRTVTAQVPLGGETWAKPGVPVTVVLPDGKKVAGRVSRVGAEVIAPAATDGSAQPGSGEAPAVPVTVRVSNQAALRAFDKTPVQVSHVVEQRKNILAVPVSALLALAEGGYGLEINDGGTTRITAVEVGMIADGRAEVRGTGLAEKMMVVIPQ